MMKYLMTAWYTHIVAYSSQPYGDGKGYTKDLVGHLVGPSQEYHLFASPRIGDTPTPCDKTTNEEYVVD